MHTIKVPKKQYYKMPNFVVFQTIVIITPYCMNFDAVDVSTFLFSLNPAQHTVLIRLVESKKLEVANICGLEVSKVFVLDGNFDLMLIWLTNQLMKKVNENKILSKISLKSFNFL